MGSLTVQIDDTKLSVGRKERAPTERASLILLGVLCGVWAFAEQVRQAFQLFFDFFIKGN